MPLGYEHRSWVFHLGDGELKIEIDEYLSKDEFKEVRKNIQDRLAGMMKSTAERVVVPRVDARANYVHAISHMGVGAFIGGRGRVFISPKTGRRIQGTKITLGNRAETRAIGLLEYGGTSRTPILASRLNQSRKGQEFGSVNLDAEHWHRDRKNRLRTNVSYQRTNRRKAKNGSGHAGAVSTPFGVRYMVSKPRRYKAQGKIGLAVDSSLPAYEAALFERVSAAIEERNGLEVTK